MRPALILENEPIVRESLRDWLRDAGYETETAKKYANVVFTPGHPLCCLCVYSGLSECAFVHTDKCTYV
jgi:hypothetical protein